MKVSVNWAKQFTSIDLPVDQLVDKIGAQLGAIEEVVDLANKYKDVIIAKIVSCQKHPNADKLSVCLIDDGGITKHVKRKDGLVEVVCGAPNVAAGQIVAWLPPGAVVPNTYDKDPFTLEAREIRGVVSNGMIASAKELALGDSHEGILVLDDNVAPGDSFPKTYGLDDIIIDIENKMFTHRPDLFGILGVAREIAGIQQKPFKSPTWYTENPSVLNDGRKNVLKLEVKNNLPKLVPRFCAVAIKDVLVQASPIWLQARLTSVGVRPINNIVDITNFFMIETAQPLHAYDYDKVKTGVLGVRESKAGEQLKLLGGKTITLDKGAIVITDGQKPIGMGGVMGGADTEVDENTKNIILECATFDMNTTRRSAMHYGLFTDAATRFTKNQSPRQNKAVLVKAIDDVKKVVGGRVASPIIDQKHFENTVKLVKTSASFVNDRLGLNLTATDMKRLLQNVEFQVESSGEQLKITAPFWRTDIEIPEDIVEEVGRLYGYDHLPQVLPTRDIEPTKIDAPLAFADRVRTILKQAGANEVLTYSFVNERLLRAAGQDPANSYHIKNAISPDLQYYRQSLTPSLLEKVHPNIKAGFDEFALFEIGKGHKKGLLDKEKLPEELERLSLVIASKNKDAAAYFAAKKTLEYLLRELGISNVSYNPLNPERTYGTAPYYEPTRGANLMIDHIIIGQVGELKQSVSAAFKLPKYCAGLDLHIDQLARHASPPSYQPLDRFPSLEQDICLKVEVKIAYSELEAFLRKTLELETQKQAYKYSLEPIDIYQKPDNTGHKQITWRITLNHQQRTLTTTEVNKLFDIIAAQAKQKFKAERI